MKELSIEEKAKAFDEALSKAKQVYKTPYTAHWDVMKELIEHLFPELAESEDEKIRKELIAYCQVNMGNTWHNIKQEDYIVWLEKQGEPTDINPNEFELHLNKLLKQFETLPKEELADSLSFYLNVVQNNGTYKPEEKQGEQETLCDKCKKEHPSHSCQDITALGRCVVEHEQKSSDKVEPKFHKGEWVVFNNRHDSVYQVEKIENYEYTLRHFLGGSMPLSFSHEDMIRTWTIKDARNGDMLSNGTTIFIFKDLLSDGSVMSYCDYDIDSGESDAFCPLLMNLMCSKITPATNEQRDILFDEMGEAGYWWNAKKKKLEKVEQTPADKKESLTDVEKSILNFADYFHINRCKPESEWVDEIKMLRDYIPSHILKPTEWNEEDEKNINFLCELLTDLQVKSTENEIKHGTNSHSEYYYNIKKWLKSLKERIGV